VIAVLDEPVLLDLQAEARDAEEALKHVVVFSPAATATSEAPRPAPEVQRVPADITQARWEAYRRFRSTVRKLTNHEEYENNPLFRELLDQTLELEERLEEDLNASDERWRVKEVVDHIEDLLDTMRREIERTLLDEPIQAARFVIGALEGADQGDVAEILGVNVRTLRAWKTGQAASVRKNPERPVIVAQAVYDLRRSMTPRGVVLWFKRSRAQLDGRTPLEVLDGDLALAAHALRSLARGVRGQLAT
jgi:hypothetical protein